MDNFMDKLAKRFNAGEIIKANAQAEARDMKRLQERTAEYEKMMMEMRRLNLKNVEVTEQVQQLIQCGIEQFEGYGNSDALILQRLEELDKELAGLKESAQGNDGELDRMIADLQRDLANTGSRLYSVQNDINEVNNSVGGIRNDVLEIGSNVSSLQYQLNSVENGMHALERAVSDNMDKGIDAQALQPILDSIGVMKEILVATRVSVEDGHRKLEEHVHKENVRVYRNVQAVVVDETGRKASEIQTRIDQLEGTVKKNGVKLIAIITMLAAVASVALQIVQILGIL